MHFARKILRLVRSTDQSQIPSCINEFSLSFVTNARIDERDLLSVGPKSVN